MQKSDKLNQAIKKAKAAMLAVPKSRREAVAKNALEMHKAKLEQDLAREKTQPR